MGNYREIDGKKLDASLLELAEKLTIGTGDGRISKADAEQLFNKVTDGGVYAEMQKETIEYIRKHFIWTDHADTWFKEEIISWRSSPKMTTHITPADLVKKHFSKHDVLKSEEERVSRMNALHAATIETNEDHDEISIVVRLHDGQRVAVVSNFIELEGEFVTLRGGHTIPVRAIEKVEI